MTHERRGCALALGAAAAILGVVVVVVGCEPVPSPSPASTTAATASDVPEITAAPTAFDPSAVTIETLDPRYVPANAATSAPGQILWTAGSGRASEIWRFVPGTQPPERIYVTPRADGHLSSIVASSAGYAFVEESDREFGKGGWRLWFLTAPGEEPIEMDRGAAPGAGVAPTIALDERRLAWASFDEPSSGPRSRLRVAPVEDLRSVTTLLDAPIEARLLWYPALSGDVLWYGTIKADFVGTADPEYHLEHIDLSQPGARPVRFPGLALDFNPALNARYLVWKTNTQGDSALNWGTLHVLDRQSGETSAIPIERANRPSIGNRFVAFDEITHKRLGVYDLATARLVDLAGEVGGTWTYGGISLSGRLLTFYTQAADGTGLPQIRWAILPE